MRIQKPFSRHSPAWGAVMLALSIHAVYASDKVITAPSEAARAQLDKSQASTRAVKTEAVKPKLITQAKKSAVPVPNKAINKPVASMAAAMPKTASIVPAVKPADLVAISTPQDFCSQVTRTLPSVNLPLCAKAQLTPTAGRSVWGRPIFQRDVVAPAPQLRVLVIGGIHGDERSSSSLVLHWIQQAAQTPANVHWRFVPLINTDGMLLNPPRRTNASGVDLNRNFPTPRWEKEAPIYWGTRTKSDPRRYPGPKPLSEPESRWIYDEMERWKPNLIVSVHAPYAVLDFDGPAVPPQRLGRLYLDQVGIYPGSLGNFGGIHKRVPVVTIELPSATVAPSEAETRQMWLDLMRWMGERLGAG